MWESVAHLKSVNIFFFFYYYKVDVLVMSTNAWYNSVKWFCMGMQFSVQFCTVWRKCSCFSLLILMNSLLTCSQESQRSSTWVCPHLCLSSSALSVLHVGEARSTCCLGCTLLSLRSCLCVFSVAGGTEGRLLGPNLPLLYTYSSPTCCSQIPPSSCFWTTCSPSRALHWVLSRASTVVLPICSFSQIPDVALLIAIL